MTKPESNRPSRRRFIGKAAYVVPLILTLQARPAYASRGSGGNDDCNRGDNDGNHSGSNGSGWFSRLVVSFTG